MYLKELQISNYKNYETTSLAFIDKVNAIVGENGSGKTNLLDAVHYLALCKSHLTSQDKNVVRFGADFFALHGVYCGFDDQRTRTISCTYKVEGHKTAPTDDSECK